MFQGFPNSGGSVDGSPWLAVALFAFVAIVVVIVLWRYFAGLQRRTEELAAFAAEHGLDFTRRLPPLRASGWDHWWFASAQDAAFLGRFSWRLVSSGRQQSVRNLAQGTWQGSHWLIFDRQSAFPHQPGGASSPVTFIVLDAGAPLPEVVMFPTNHNLMLTAAHVDEADFGRYFRFEGTDGAAVKASLDQSAERELLAAVAGPLERLCRIFSDGPHLVLWYHGVASVAQIAIAMDVLLSLQTCIGQDAPRCDHV